MSIGSSPLARGALKPDNPDLYVDRLIPAGAGSTVHVKTTTPWATAHPRWRGEHFIAPPALAPSAGSSPLARGALRRPPHLVIRPRLIPAGAGSTLPTSSSRRLRTAHPRWRGEHWLRAWEDTRPAGSSPLARGARRSHMHVVTVTVAHPRWRGEHKVGEMSLSQIHGSSPLARGARTIRLQAKRFSRLTPAGAGSTTSCHSRTADSSAHPRWRGEHAAAYANAPGASGSSPLARGALELLYLANEDLRLIPAGAGSTDTWLSGQTVAAAHPRWRGEHKTEKGREIWQSGSSPLARGAHGVHFRGAGRWRLIPAGAGSTCTLGESTRAYEAHPRWRGEHVTASSWRVMSTGSSPLARGAPSEWQPYAMAGRLIPAGAGSTHSGTAMRSVEPAHPRWRGEHREDNGTGAMGIGSSPLARGAHRGEV